jgi:VWFA-related protein
MNNLRRLLILAIVAAFLPSSASALARSQSDSEQPACLTSDEVKSLVARFESEQAAPPDKKLKGELLKLTEKNQKIIQDALSDAAKKEESAHRRMAAAMEENGAQLCRILKSSGWPTEGRVGKDGVAAAVFLLKNSEPPRLQLEVLPVVAAAAKRGEVETEDFASLVDRLRVRAGLRQLFGTQVSVSGGFLVLYPIEAEAQVEARRKQYGLPPLSDYLRRLEMLYQTPLVRSPADPAPAQAGVSKNSVERAVASSLLEPQPVEDEEVVRVESNLVSFNASVYSGKHKSYISTLGQSDFAVFEDGRREEVSFFARTDVPFDLVLLLDLSGSTAGKRDLIREATRHFIEAARPSDRIAVVTFTTEAKVVSPLTDDRAKLLASAGEIEGNGGTNLWDALKFILDQVIGPKTSGRRRAVVLMSDGEDNALTFIAPSRVAFRGSHVTFSDLVEAVRHNDTMIIPIHLDTWPQGMYYNPGSSFGPFAGRLHENGRKTLALLAEESGGAYYNAGSIGDLKGVYDQVINDLGKVYSLGYRPTNEKRDGSWRAVKIEIPDRPDLTVRARPGYYAN